ncbi:MAG: HAD family phosphatase [Clostridia bacterium]
MIKNIIFDLGNVIINYNQKKIINNFTEKEEEIKYIYDEIFHAPEWTLMDLGDITNDEAIEIINKRNEFKYEKLTQEFLHEWHKKQPINRDIVEIAKILKNNGYNLFVLSNMANQTYEYFKNDEFFSLCTGIVISAHEHVKKPDEKVYRLLLDRYNLNAEECLFIDDDDSGKNYETANKIGIKGRRIMPNQAEDVKKLLLEFNVKI